MALHFYKLDRHQSRSTPSCSSSDSTKSTRTVSLHQLSAMFLKVERMLNSAMWPLRDTIAHPHPQQAHAHTSLDNKNTPPLTQCCNHTRISPHLNSRCAVLILTTGDRVGQWHRLCQVRFRGLQLPIAHLPIARRKTDSPITGWSCVCVYVCVCVCVSSSSPSFVL